MRQYPNFEEFGDFAMGPKIEGFYLYIMTTKTGITPKQLQDFVVNTPTIRITWNNKKVSEKVHKKNNNYENW